MFHTIFTLKIMVAASFFAGTVAIAQPCGSDTAPCDLPIAYQIQELGTFGGPGTFSNATGLNEMGHVAGVAEDDSFNNHGVLYRDGEMIDLGSLVPSGVGTTAKGINDHDQIVGQTATPLGEIGSVSHPFLWTEGEGMIDLAPPGHTGSGWAWGVNNHGQVALRLNGPYFWDPVEGLRAITAPHCTVCGGEAWEINDAGQIAGEIRGKDLFLHAYRYDSSRDMLTDLHDAVTYRHTIGYGINELGDVVGYGVRHSGANHPMLWTADGQTIELPIGDLGGEFFETFAAEDINDRGDIVGEDDSIIPGNPNVSWITFEATSSPIQKIPLESYLSPIDAAQWELTWAFDVNNSRQIAGFGLKNGVTRAFVLTPIFPGDCDADGDIDLTDFASFQLCFTGPSGPGGAGDDCRCSDFDNDGDVDLSDFSAFQLAFTGSAP